MKTKECISSCAGLHFLVFYEILKRHIIIRTLYWVQTHIVVITPFLWPEVIEPPIGYKLSPRL